MYDEENVQTEETVVDDSGVDDGISGDPAGGSGSESLSESDGDVGQAKSDDVSSGDAKSSDVSSGDISSVDVSSGDASEDNSYHDGYPGISAYTEVSPDYSEYLLSLQASLVSIDSTLFLIFLFLILSWTEKKISVSVRKFTRERRR